MTGKIPRGRNNLRQAWSGGGHWEKSWGWQRWAWALTPPPKRLEVFYLCGYITSLNQLGKWPDGMIVSVLSTIISSSWGRLHIGCVEGRASVLLPQRDSQTLGNSSLHVWVIGLEYILRKENQQTVARTMLLLDRWRNISRVSAWFGALSPRGWRPLAPHSFNSWLLFLLFLNPSSPPLVLPLLMSCGSRHLSNSPFQWLVGFHFLISKEWDYLTCDSSSLVPKALANTKLSYCPKTLKFTALKNTCQILVMWLWMTLEQYKSFLQVVYPTHRKTQTNCVCEILIISIIHDEIF